MTIYKIIHGAVSAAIVEAVNSGNLALNGEMPSFVVEPPRDASHGDLATNVAMVLAKAAGKPPRAIAEILKPKLEQNKIIVGVEIAGPGFINLRLQPEIWRNEIREILGTGTHYGDSEVGQGAKVNVEFVSVNPTGPMHAGHVRGAVIGDTLVRLMRKASYNVVGEYYFNDAGAQVDVLARTTHLRYREALGENIGTIPEGYYPGEYLQEVGAALAQRDGAKWQGKPESEWLLPVREFAVAAMMKMIREDLDMIGIHHDVFTNERELIENGTLEKVFKILEDKDLIYTGTLPPPKGKEMEDWEPTPLILFRSSKFGDSTDRPLKKRDGYWAYIMPDIAYHYDKIRRGFSLMINVLGADHGGYLERMRPAVAALSNGEAHLTVIYNSMVKIFKNGEPVKLSKRSGNLITLREMVEQVGANPVRFFMLTRDPKSPLDFDFAKVIEQTRDNPVFYVQYAHARCSSIMRHAAEMFPREQLLDGALAKVSLDAINSPEELLLIKGMANWSRAVEAAALAQEPHRIAFYLLELAGLFHALWHKGNDNANLRFIVPDDKNLTLARLALINAVRIVLRSGFAVMGCTPWKSFAVMPQSQHDLRVSERPVRSDFGREKSYARRRLLTLIVLAALIGGILYYVWGGGTSNPADIPTIKADGTYKQKPTDPGGIDIPHQDVRVYDELENKAAAPDQVEHLLPPPETPEFAGKPVPPAPVAQIAPAPAPLPPVTAPSEAHAPLRLQSLDELAGVTRKSAPIMAPPAPQPTPVAPAPSPQVATIDQVIKNVSPSATAKASEGQAPSPIKGSAVIQLASSNDRVKAQAMMQNLQQKYADQLGEAVLRLVRADLGSKGVFYRIQSQGLSADEASQICASLKNQNAGCILVRK